MPRFAALLFALEMERPFMMAYTSRPCVGNPYRLVVPAEARYSGRFFTLASTGFGF
jgi:hypothetical protein